MELREYVRALRRRWLWIVVPVVLAIGAAVGLTLAAPPAYRSSMVLFVTTGTGDPDAKASRLNSYIVLLTGPRVAESVISELNLPLSTKQVQDRISAQVQDGTDLLEVSVTDESAERSRSIVTTATSALVGLAKQLDPPSTAPDAGPPPSVTVAQDPVTAREPGKLARNIGFSAALGLLIGAAAIALREATRKTATDEDDLRRLGLGTVGVISLGGRSGRGGYADEALAEAFRRLRSLLPDMTADRRPGARGTSMLITGPNEKEGTTAVACGLAIAMAETGAKVALVDANMRAPGVSRYLSLENSPGLSEVLTGTAGLPDVLQDTLDGRLTVLPPGERPADPGEVLASPRLAPTLRDLTDHFDVVLVDAPALQPVADAAVLAKVTDSALLVVRSDHTRLSDVAKSKDLLERVGARLAGAVLNALPRKLPTKSAWHREVTGQPDAELVAGLYGDEPADDTGPAGEADETVVPRAPVRGRARVVQATIVTEDENEDDDDDDPPATGGAARGQARVVVITDAQEPANLPAPRKPERQQEQQSGE